MPRATVAAATAPRSVALTISVLFSTIVSVSRATAATTTVAVSTPVDITATDATVPLPSAVVAAAHVWTTVLLALVLALLVVVYAQPAWAMDLVVRHSHTSVLWCVSTSARVCSLTIDDAPSPATPQILDLLRDHGVKATFFIISNNIQGNEEVVRRIVREGHRLGNHLTEDRASILDELHVFEQKLKECDTAVARFQSHSPHPLDKHAASEPSARDVGAAVDEASDVATAPIESTERTWLLDATDSSSSGASTPASSGATTSSKWLRPASGWFTSNMREIVQSHGYKICMGSVYPHDAQIKSERLNALFLRLRTRPGAVLIVHDRAWTVGVLREALPELVRRFKFVSLDELSLHHHTHKVKCAT